MRLVHRQSMLNTTHVCLFSAVLCRWKREEQSAIVNNCVILLFSKKALDSRNELNPLKAFFSSLHRLSCPSLLRSFGLKSYSVDRYIQRQDCQSLCLCLYLSLFPCLYSHRLVILPAMTGHEVHLGYNRTIRRIFLHISVCLQPGFD